MPKYMTRLPCMTIGSFSRSIGRPIPGQKHGTLYFDPRLRGWGRGLGPEGGRVGVRVRGPEVVDMARFGRLGIPSKGEV